jgi:hypothetical protein
MRIEAANRSRRRGVLFVFERVISETNISETDVSETDKGDGLNLRPND